MQPGSDSIGGQLTSMSSAIHWQKISLKGKGNTQVLFALYNLLDYLRNTLATFATKLQSVLIDASVLKRSAENYEGIKIKNKPTSHFNIKAVVRVPYQHWITALLPPSFILTTAVGFVVGCTLSVEKIDQWFWSLRKCMYLGFVSWKSTIWTFYSTASKMCSVGLKSEIG